MTRRTVFDHDRLARTRDAQHQVISRIQALACGVPRSTITGPAALRAYRLRVPGLDVIDILVPQATRRQNIGFVRIHRTRQLPRVRRIGPVRFAEPTRAVADATQVLPSLDDVRAGGVVAGAAVA